MRLQISNIDINQSGKVIAEDGLLIGCLQSLYDNIAWTHKIHEKQADIDLFKCRLCQWISIFLMAVTSTGILTSFVFSQPWIKIVSSVAATLALLISIVREAKAYELVSCNHVSFARDYLSLKSDLKSALINDCADMDKLKKAFECAQCKYNQLNSHAPRTGKIAVWCAEKAYSNNELKLFKLEFDIPERGENE